VSYTFRGKGEKGREGREKDQRRGGEEKGGEERATGLPFFSTSGRL